MMPVTIEVVICFHFSIFVPLETTLGNIYLFVTVVICFHFSIFVPLETTSFGFLPDATEL